MLYLNTKEEKKMVFEVEISGVEEEDLFGEVNFLINGVKYGFPVFISEDRIETVVPPLKKVVGWEVKSGTILDASLDLHTESCYFTPWKGQIKVGSPVEIKAKLEMEDTSKPRVSTKLRTEVEPVLENTKKREGRDQVSEVLDRLTSDEKFAARTQKAKKAPTPKAKKPTNINEMKSMLTKENIYKFMEKCGTKNRKIQDIVYEQAIQAAGGEGDMLKVLKKLTEIMRIKKK